MELTDCPHCGRRVAVTAEGNCPACHRGMAEAPAAIGDDSSDGTPASDPARAPADGMTVGEKLCSAAVILICLLLLITLSSFHFVVLPGSEDPGALYFITSIMWIEFLGLGLTVALNLNSRSLLLIPTVVQCAMLCLTGYGIPIAVWGGILLNQRIQREKAEV